MKKTNYQLKRAYSHSRESFHTLPNELMIDILSRVPVKSLIRLKSVSKSFCSFIQNPIYANLIHQSRWEPIIMGSPNLYQIDAKGIATELYSIPYFQFSYSSKFCNGLICALSYDDNSFRICNPATQLFFKLPTMNLHSRDTLFEFGFDPRRRVYKVLSWNYTFDCTVFTLGTQSWRTITSKRSYALRGNFLWSLCLKGKFYWWNDNKGTVISFNLFSEKFELIQGPKLKHGRVRTRYSLRPFELVGYLCLLDDHASDIEPSFQWIIDMWKLRDNSGNGWVMMKSIILPCIGIDLRTPYCSQSGEIVIGISSNGSKIIYLYSLLTHEVTVLKTSGVPSAVYTLVNHTENFVRYEGALASLNKIILKTLGS
ncbi:hypothetical protein ACHQM5_010826 [Ranunculus cassubicifolius]